MIRKNKKVCKGCGKEEYIFAKGKCERCQDKKPIKTKSNKIKISTYKIKQSRKDTLIKKKRISKIREKYFEHHIEQCKFSEESGNTISNPTRANICHLFSKRTHKSIQDNLDNAIYLTMSEHSRFDQLLDSHRFHDLEKEFPNSWARTCKKMILLLELVQENTIFTRSIKTYLDGRIES